MDIGFPILSFLTFAPVLGAILALVLPKQAFALSFGVSLAVLLGSVGLVMGFDGGQSAFQFVEKAAWLPALSLSYHMGVDGISLYLVVLSALLTPICLVAANKRAPERLAQYLAAFLVLETFMIGTFCALDTVLFYVFFEGSLIPMFFIIGLWGGAGRVRAAFMFFLYTLLGSVLMLVALLAIYVYTGSTDIAYLAQVQLPPHVQNWLFLAMLASFAVKLPMWPVHTWLPEAHVEAPTEGSVILAGVLLKMGGYGFLRLALPLLPDAAQYFAPLIFGLSIVAIIYTSLVALVQTDMKKMIAYSSVAHMGFVSIGIFSLTAQGINGAIFQMVSHGVVSAALFLGVGVLYERTHTRDLGHYGGIVKNMPVFATLFMIFMLGAVGLPGTSGFVGEFLVLLGTFKVSTWVAALAGTGLVLGASYMLWLYRKVFFGTHSNAEAALLSDVCVVERVNLGVLALIVLALGVMPSALLHMSSATVDGLLTGMANLQMMGLKP